MVGFSLLPIAALAASTLAKPHQLPLPSNDASVVDLHRALVEIPSVTDDEKAIDLFLATYLRTQNLTVDLLPVFDTKDRYNVLAYPPGKRDTSILVTSHIDTVPPFLPYTYDEETHMIGGRGSVDAKASVAAQIMAVQHLRAQLDDDISLLFVVGEEVGGDGMKAFSAWKDEQKVDYKAVIFGEPTEGKLVCGHKGIFLFRVKVTGKAAHSGYPWLGVSANEVLVEALSTLMQARKHLPKSEKFGITTMNIGRMEGGVADNVVAQTASAGLAVRLAAGTPEDIKVIVSAALEDLEKETADKGGKLELEWVHKGYGPVEIDCAVEGFETMTVNYGTDVPNLKGDHKRFLYGPGSILVAHGDDEAIKEEELEGAVGEYEKLILGVRKMLDEDEQSSEHMEM